LFTSAGRAFPGRDPIQPLATRRLNRACHAAAQMAVSLHTLGHSFPTYLLQQKVTSSGPPTRLRRKAEPNMKQLDKILR
jgi:hypothetical protein